MRTKIRDKAKLLALPWPDEAPVMADDDICNHTEPKQGRKSVWEWIRLSFPVDPVLGDELQDQFAHVLFWVMQRSLDNRDKGRTCFSDVPSPSSSRNTLAPYSAAEVAAWWNEALKIIGYELDNE